MLCFFVSQKYSPIFRSPNVLRHPPHRPPVYIRLGTTTIQLLAIYPKIRPSATVLEFPSPSTYPVAWGAKNYNAGNKIWCIPSGGLLNSIANTSILSKINLGIYAANGTQLGNINNGKENIWSSSKSASGNTITWNLYISSTNQSGMSNSNILNNYSSYSVRPVMAF